MPKLKENAVPSYRLHRQSGQAIVTLNGKDILLGRHATPTSRTEYRRLIAEWIANGRHSAEPSSDMTISELVNTHRVHAEKYYEGSAEPDNFRLAMRPLLSLYGPMQAAEFGSLKLKAVRELMVNPPPAGLGWSRNYANRQTWRIKQLFKWATENEHVPPIVYHKIVVVESLKTGRTIARETAPVEPVAENIVEVTIPYLAPPVAAIVKLQLRAGARGGELFKLRTCDIDRSGPVWKYRPTAHKTAHHGHRRVIFFGPQAQEVLRPFLKLDLQAYLFTPGDAVTWRNEQQRAKRQTPLTPSQRRRAEAAAKRQRRLTPTYNKASYARAIARGCEAAFGMPEEYRQTKDDRPAAGDTPAVQAAKAKRREEKRLKRSAWHDKNVWHPHQLRHTAGTNYRREGDFESAKIVLGHHTDSMTQRYAERDERRAEQIVGKIG